MKRDLAIKKPESRQPPKALDLMVRAMVSMAERAPELLLQVGEALRSDPRTLPADLVRLTGLWKDCEAKAFAFAEAVAPYQSPRLTGVKGRVDPELLSNDELIDILSDQLTDAEFDALILEASR